MRQRIILLILPFITTLYAAGQDTIRLDDAEVLYRVILDGDTFLLSQIEEVHIYSKPKFKTQREWRKYYRLVRNVKKVYPYAKLAAAEYDSLAQYMMTLPTEKERKQYIKDIESEIMINYEDDIKKLTITQGRILLKLIDREIGETSYDLLKELKGSFSAFFWQAIARLFGHDLKSEFDPEGADKLLNEIVILLEAGQI
jgi:hypothetical protein